METPLRALSLAAVLLLAPAAAWAQGAPVRTGPPNVPQFRPAFAGQTRAPEVVSTIRLQVTRLASGLRSPWALAFLPDGRMLVTEKAPFALRIIGRDGQVSAPVTGLPKADDRNQGGLLDVVVAPDFDRTGLIYWSYSEPRQGGNGTAVARGRLVDGNPARLEDVRSVFRMMPTLDSTLHFGSRLVFAPDGTLFVTLGERSILPGRVQAQDLGSDLGKIVRINRDGTIPPDNPFVGRPGVRPEIWSYGHRNIQSATLDGQGRLWVGEMGPRGGDELNRPERGRDYGWPTISYGEEYSGSLIGRGMTQAEGMEQPVYYWDPVIAPSGMVIYSGDLFPEWRGNAFLGGLAVKALVRLVMDGDRVVGEERLLTDLNARIRDVRQGPDGALYVLTDSSDGQLLRLLPRS